MFRCLLPKQNTIFLNKELQDSTRKDPAPFLLLTVNRGLKQSEGEEGKLIGPVNSYFYVRKRFAIFIRNNGSRRKMRLFSASVTSEIEPTEITLFPILLRMIGSPVNDRHVANNAYSFFRPNFFILKRIFAF